VEVELEQLVGLAANIHELLALSTLQIHLEGALLEASLCWAVRVATTD
jgi:hypothetical protein